MLMLIKTLNNGASYNVSKEKYFNLLVVIPDDHKMVGYKAPSSATEVKKAFAGWNPL